MAMVTALTTVTAMQMLMAWVNFGSTMLNYVFWVLRCKAFYTHVCDGDGDGDSNDDGDGDSDVDADGDGDDNDDGDGNGDDDRDG